MVNSGALFYAMVSGLLMSGGVAAVAFVIRMLAARRQNAFLQRRLSAIAQPRNRRGAASLSWATVGQESRFSGLLLRTGLYQPLDKLIARAALGGSPDSLGRAMAFAALCGSVMAGIVSRGVITLIVPAALLAAAFPVLRLYLRALKRQRMFDEQLPDALDFMSRALRAGHGLTMSFQMVAEELPSPISEEFQRIFDEINFGTSFQDALGGLAYRIDSQDLGFFVVGVLIQRETGGNLSELLHSLSSTIRERFKLQGKVRTLAAEGKYSGILLGTLPAVMGAILSLINPTYMSELWDTPTGQKWLAISVCLMLFGSVWMLKIAKIKV